MVVVEAGKSLCKGPVAGPGLACWRSSKEVLIARAEWERGTAGGESKEEIWQVFQGLVSHREDGILPHRGAGNRESCGQRRDGTYSDAHRHPLVAAAVRTDSGWGGSLVSRAGQLPVPVRLRVPTSAWTCSLSGSLHEVVCMSLSEAQAPCPPCLSPALEGGWTGLVSPCLPHGSRPCLQEMVITNLQPETTYSITVAAYTMKGDGARSKPKVVVTKGAGMRPPLPHGFFACGVPAALSSPCGERVCWAGGAARANGVGAAQGGIQGPARPNPISSSCLFLSCWLRPDADS